MSEMKTLTPLAQTYVDRFDAARAALPGSGNERIALIRRDGLDAFAAKDFPGRKVEEWRFTNLAPLTKGLDGTAEKAANADLPAPEFATPHVMTFVNGQFAPAESKLDTLPKGVRLTSLAEELEEGSAALIEDSDADPRALVALNTAFMADGYVLEAAPGVTLDAPILIRFISLPGTAENARHMRNIIRLGEKSRLTVIEEHGGTDGHAYFANPVADIRLAADARLNFYKYQAESDAAFHLADTDVTLAEGATFENFALTTGARLARNELETRLTGAGATSILNGAYLIRGKQHADTTTLTRHLVAETDSRQVYKGILDEEAHGVFQGKIQIVKDAQKVAGDQLSRALLLSDTAHVAVKPELEIHADDVKCSHGASSGELDEDALFYLQSRGIEATAARKMLIDAFLADVLEEVSNEAVRAYFADVTARWMDRV
ncbi:MAG: Fe-S cluster assembly protein SufD [Sneathiella sp.]|uniref:Fe-S cluster assembly protein SufD n=1 Tax=Sneathiella sp. TaxID=1964365 RepID=UPI000C4F7210|nr:Fe-S cluster assembly protein SufD [Sneathiella sp.]MAL80233.1 Fe-S cluster assembly protein SufD [Sneathiella sp.]